MRIRSAVVAVLVVCVSLSTAADTFFVAPRGNDAWSGRMAEPNEAGTDGPFASLSAARDAARALAPGERRRIVMLSGEYFFETPVMLNASDNGLTIEAAPNAEVTLYGGRRISGWAKWEEDLYAVDLPGVKDGTWDFRSLVVNGRYCPRARYPREGRLQHQTTFSVPWMGTAGGGWQRKPTEEELTRLVYRPDDLGPWLDVRNAEITVYHMWDESAVGLAAMDAESRVLTFNTPTRHPPGAFDVHDYVVWNTREGMTDPGQWYLDRTAGRLVYWPLPGEDMGEADVIAPVIESILVVRGTDDHPASDITIRGLRLSVSNTPLKAGDFGAGAFEGALSAASTANLRVSNVEVVNVGGQGIRTWKCAGLRIEDCHVHHTGACGIMPRGDGAVAVNNHIHDVGLTYPSAIGLWTGGGATIRHNEIHDTPYSAIALGGENSVIESNLIYRPMLELHDGAAIYVSGGKGVEIRGNFVRDIVDTGGYGASAYYLDELCEGCTVEGNLSVNVAWPLHNHIAKNNVVRNNVFLISQNARLTFTRSEGYTFEKNVVCAQGHIMITNPAAMATFKDNVIFSAAGVVEGRALDQYKDVGEAPLDFGSGNTFADPGVSGGENGAIRFAADSPAVGLGIAPIDVSRAGLE
ncbi:MAG TPA: right-handed parallel beta-helix repeat-containing protein [Candidatus Hydrogenedentes bacterium]|nr:right-handed parallel beta-helix repeat-containing protein [Candidatus Hydrogenedentota bacterium]HPG65380.1 right-handed parallel beta-helix repeat-containing protein [Candidatus Hydrogenedentota bacterium]